MTASYDHKSTTASYLVLQGGGWDQSFWQVPYKGRLCLRSTCYVEGRGGRTRRYLLASGLNNVDAHIV